MSTRTRPESAKSGATVCHTVHPRDVPRQIRSAAQRAANRQQRVVDRVVELRRFGEALPVIAAILNCEGYRNHVGAPYTPIEVWRILSARHANGRGEATSLAQHGGSP